MQTFLPYADFSASAKALDYKRLGKQRVETWQIIRAASGLTKGWVNHPATRMWNGYEKALCFYGIAICMEWKRRGYNDTMLPRFLDHLATLDGPVIMPPWLGDDAFHKSHQSNLIRKDPEFYGPLFPGTVDNLDYIWPAVEAVELQTT